ncbi:hypothetical protein RFI_07830 [Reticulomyxa filosa]|uniref:VHS domain-containing protein n=1 Tax=Reticulomyxa filosa TaxID=46433 RepID=X6NTH7_RETFI|nr:hypothetical protein RFI_07830 [Reticulomyxa filosa]|eukprot:ETO29291.1 hypothetical protein RFI_07830 [Reticulomyxa filosa]
MLPNEVAGPPGTYFELKKTKLTKTIKEACSEFLSGPDWDKNIEVIDELNRLCGLLKRTLQKGERGMMKYAGEPYLSGFVIEELRKMLKTKNPEIEILALTLVEGVIKNCPSSHGAIAQPAFMRYLVKVALDQRKDGFWKGAAKKLFFFLFFWKINVDKNELMFSIAD